MSDEKGKVADKASEIAKNIWLAGVGAYGKAAGEAQDRLEKAGVETPKLFKDLVKAGAALESEAKKGISAGQSASNSVEERINRVRENFSLNRLGRTDEATSLHAKVDLLSMKIDLLTNALAEQGLIKPPKTRSKPAAKKKVAAKRKPSTAAAAKAKSKSTASSRSKAAKRKD